MEPKLDPDRTQIEVRKEDAKRTSSKSSWGGPGEVLEPSWNDLGPSWPNLRPSWDDLEAAGGCRITVFPKVVQYFLKFYLSRRPRSILAQTGPTPLFRTSNSTQLHSTQHNSTQLISTHFLTLRGAHFGASWPPKSTQDRLKSPLDTSFFQKPEFSRNIGRRMFGPFPGPQDGTQNDPRLTQDGSKTIFKSIFFRLHF